MFIFGKPLWKEMKRRKFIIDVTGLGLVVLGDNFKLIGQTFLHSANYVVEQFEDKGLAHFSYAVMAGKKIVIIDPQRNPRVLNIYNFSMKKQNK